MDKVRAKKHLGQHFLKDESIAKQIADTLTFKKLHKSIRDWPWDGSAN